MLSSPSRQKSRRTSISNIVPVVATETLEQLPIFHIDSSVPINDNGEKQHDWNDVKSKLNSKLGQNRSQKNLKRRKSNTHTSANLRSQSIDLNKQIDDMRTEHLRRKASRLKMKRSRTRRNLEIENLKGHTIIYELTHSVIHPTWATKRIWDYIVLLVMLYVSIQIPMLLAFPDLVEYTWVSYSVDGIFIIDFFLCFRTAFLKPDFTYEMNPTKIRKHYMNYWFWFDAPACLPLDMFVPRDSSRQLETLARVLKIPRIFKLAALFKYLNSISFEYANTVKISKFIFMLLLIAHWTGCIFFFIMGMENQYGAGTWIENNWGVIVDGEEIGQRYVLLFYTAFLMLVGEGIGPVTWVETIFSTLALLLGTIVTAVIVGNVSFVVSNQNSLKYQRQSRIDRITDEMRALNIPPALLQRTLDYYDYLWRRHRTFDPSELRFVNELSPTLQKEILLHLNREVILNCNFFSDVSNRCILRLLFSFQSAVYIQDDYITEEGEMAGSLILLLHGNASVVRGESLMPITLLHPGDYFGEKALLLDHRNATSVIAQTNCDTRVLHKNDFKKIVKEFPELREAILNQSEHLDVSEYDTHMQRHKNVRTASRRKLHLHQAHLEHTNSYNNSNNKYSKSTVHEKLNEHIDTIGELNDKFDVKFQEIAKSQKILNTKIGQIFHLLKNQPRRNTSEIPLETQVRNPQVIASKQKKTAIKFSLASSSSEEEEEEEDRKIAPSPPLPDMAKRRMERDVGRSHHKFEL